MKPHPRIRKTVKWGGVAAIVFISIVFVRSGWVRWDFIRNGHHFSMTHGEFRWMHQRLFGRYIATFDDRMWYDMAWRPSWGNTASGSWVTVPVWIPLAVTLMATVLAWYLDRMAHRRARLKFCPKCNYDRAGIAGDAKCPECGHARA